MICLDIHMQKLLVTFTTSVQPFQWMPYGYTVTVSKILNAHGYTAMQRCQRSKLPMVKQLCSDVIDLSHKV